ncbi:hypothetical protein ACET3Z_018544 [Daucus carota]
MHSELFSKVLRSVDIVRGKVIILALKPYISLIGNQNSANQTVITWGDKTLIQPRKALFLAPTDQLLSLSYPITSAWLGSLLREWAYQTNGGDIITSSRFISVVSSSLTSSPSSDLSSRPFFNSPPPGFMAEAPASPCVASPESGGDFRHESGGDQSPRSFREQDRFLPIANISRIMKKGLPANGKIAKDAKETVQECVSEFISFITSEASDKCQREKRKTINGDDLLWAMATLGFEDYIEPLKVYLARYREMEVCKCYHWFYNLYLLLNCSYYYTSSYI